jgi:regulatory protein
VAKVITALKFSGRGQNRVDVYLDGKKDFSLIKSVALELKNGQELSVDQIKQLIDRDLEEQIYQQALRLISRRPRSEKELRDRFKRKHAQSEIQDAAIARLREQGFVDDYAFAESWVENRLNFRPRSAWAIKQELRHKGVPNDAIQAALEDFNDEEAAYQAASKAARKMAGLSKDRFNQRLAAYLSRRGFQYSTVFPIVKRVWRETSSNCSESEV